MKRLVLILFTGLALTVFLSSCVKYSVLTNLFVDSTVIPQGFPVGTSFAVLSIRDDNRLFSKEVCHKIEKLLAEKGYTIANASHAKYALFVDFSISSSVETVNVPHYIPGQTQTTQGNVHGTYGNYGSYKETTETSGTTIYVPQTQVFFTRMLALSVHETKLLKKKQSEDPVWTGNSVSVGQNGDLRIVIDYLLVSAFKHFGVSTGKFVENELTEGDKAIKRLNELS